MQRGGGGGALGIMRRHSTSPKKKEIVARLMDETPFFFFFPPPSKWCNSSDFRETNSIDGKFQIQYLLLSPSPRSCSRVTVSLWFSWNLNGVSRERRNIRRSKRSPLRASSPPITVPIKGGGIEPPPFFLFSSFFLLRGWVDRCKGREERGSSTLRVCWRHF